MNPFDTRPLSETATRTRHPHTPNTQEQQETGSTPGSPVILVVSSSGTSPGAEAYRSYALAGVAAAYDVVLISPTEPTWEVRHLIDFEVADPRDTDALLAAGRKLAARHQVAGVMTWTEWHLVAVAELAQDLGLPTSGPDVMRACRNKNASRTRFAQHGVPSAASLPVSNLTAAEAAAARIGYPLVVKPAAQACSTGVMRVDHPDDLAAAYEIAARAAAQCVESTRVLVEEYLSGPEVSVECVTHRGATAAVAVTRKTLGPPPFFEEVAHLVDGSDPLLTTVAPVATAAVQALGITHGISHVEMRVVNGEPRLIEVNARIAGDLIGHLVRLATGIDLPRAAADIACGRTPQLAPTRDAVAGVRFLYPDHPARVQAITIDPEVLAQPWCERIVTEQVPGAEVAPPPAGGIDDRLAHLIVTADNPAQYSARAEDALLAVHTDLAPLAVPAADGATR